MDIKDLTIIVLFTFFAFALILMFCEVGQRLFFAFEDIQDQLWNSGWYTFPKKIRQIMPVFIAYLQNPLVIRGIGNIKCKREDFKNVSLLILIMIFFLLIRGLSIFLRLFQKDTLTLICLRMLKKHLVS